MADEYRNKYKALKYLMKLRQQGGEAYSDATLESKIFQHFTSATASRVKIEVGPGVLMVQKRSPPDQAKPYSFKMDNDLKSIKMGILSEILGHVKQGIAAKRAGATEVKLSFFDASNEKDPTSTVSLTL